MNVHTHAHQPAHHAPAGRKAIKQLNERLRRDRRDLAEAMRERVVRECYPARDEEPMPSLK